MTSIVTNFKSIKRKLDRMEQKAEFEAKEAAERASYAGLYGTMVPLKSMAHPQWPYAGTPHAWRIKI